MTAQRWELGGEFHWMGLPEGPFISLPSNTVWYSLARHAITQVMELCGAKVLWIPEYFCEDVVEHIEASFEVKRYVDNPTRMEPEWQTLSPVGSDLVLAVNYFGMRSFMPWYSWASISKCMLLEDHSHDPAYGFKYSRADYAVSSLRKTLPAPDGALLWSPVGHVLPKPPFEMSAGTEEKLAAMIWKLEYLSGRTDETAKGSFREWQIHGEETLCRQPVTMPAPESHMLCSRGIPEAWLERRRSNVAYLLQHLYNFPAARFLLSSKPEGGTPFGAILKFTSHERREQVRRYLIENRIYCPVHWPAGKKSSDEAKHLSDTVLTLISDQRYGIEDMARVIDIIHRSSKVG